MNTPALRREAGLHDEGESDCPCLFDMNSSTEAKSTSPEMVEAAGTGGFGE
jgi:hypothetical protein